MSFGPTGCAEKRRAKEDGRPQRRRRAAGSRAAVPYHREYRRARMFAQGLSRVPIKPMADETAAGDRTDRSPDLKDRLAIFLSRFQELRVVRPTQIFTVVIRLRHYLEEARRAGLTPNVAQVNLFSLTAAKLSATLDQLRSPLALARTSGAALNIWRVAGLKRNEVRNAAVLAWFLDPKGSHGLGTACIYHLLHEAFRDHADWLPGEPSLANASVRTELRPQGSDTDRVDIAMEGDSFLIFMEVKIDALEGVNQLLRYAAAARAIGKSWCLLYLSSRQPKQLPPKTVQITWRDVVATLQAVAINASPFTRQLMSQFASHIRKF